MIATVSESGVSQEETEKDSKKVPGFSVRFNQLLDMAGFPSAEKKRSGRYTTAADRFGVKATTIRCWCLQDTPPRQFTDLIKVVRIMLEDTPGTNNPESVAAWLLSGNEKINPLTTADRKIDFMRQVDIDATIYTILKNYELPSTYPNFEIADANSRLKSVVTDYMDEFCPGQINANEMAKNEDLVRIVKTTISMFYDI